MKKIILFTVLALLILTGFVLLKRKSESVNLLKKNITALKQDSVRMWSVNDKLVSERQAYEVNKGNIDILKKELDDYKFKLGLEKVKNKRLESLVEAHIQSNGSGSVIVQNDTIYVTTPSDSTHTNNNETLIAKTFEVNDDYLTFSGRLINDSLQYRYSYTDSIYFAIFQKSTGWFKPKVTTVRASLANPESSVTGLNSIVIRERTPKLILGLTAGYGLSGNGFAPFLGIGITKPILTIK